MLDKLIESKNNVGANRRLSNLLLSTFTIFASVMGVGLLYSLFTYNLAVGAESLEISTLLAPITEFEKTPPEEIAPVKKQQPNEKTASDLPMRQENIRRLEETPIDVPKEISVTPMTKQERLKSAFEIGKDDTNPAASNSGANGRGNGENSTGIEISPKPQAASQNTEIEVEPVIKQTKKPDLPKVTTVSKGVINGEAKNLIKPAYPQPAKLVGASGEVKVQVAIDEEGRVVSAVAVSGHPLLRPAAAGAARSSTFTPTYLSGQKVKVTGIIIYNFTR